MITILLDTCILIDLLRGRSAPLSYLDDKRNKTAISVVSVTELYYGARSAKEEIEIETLVASLKIIPVDKMIAQQAGVFLKHYEASHQIGPIDAIIAATAEHHELQLATLNVKHFPMFSRLQKSY